MASNPRFIMHYPDHERVDDGEDVEVVWTVPKVWYDAPVDGMQAIVAHRPDGSIAVYDGADYYLPLLNGQPVQTDDVGPILRTAGLLKCGLWIPDEEYEGVRERIRGYRRYWERKQKQRSG